MPACLSLPLPPLCLESLLSVGYQVMKHFKKTSARLKRLYASLSSPPPSSPLFGALPFFCWQVMKHFQGLPKSDGLVPIYIE